MNVGNQITICRNALNTAKLISCLKYFYFPCYMDWRGRIYSRGEFLNYQASKHGLALLRFKRTVRITASGIVYLKLYGATLFGIGKSSDNRLS